MLFFVMLLFPSLVQAGVIMEAQPIVVSLTKILNFLLIVFGLIAILGMLIAGLLYFTAGGDERRVQFAKRAFAAGVTGIVIALGSLVLIFTITRLLV